MSAARTIEWGTTRIPYSLTRSARQKTLSIRVEPDGRVEVVAPASVADDRVGAIVLRKAAWIVERRRRAEDMPPRPSPRDFVSGETFLYLGRQCRLRVRAGEIPGVRLVEGRLEVVVERGLVGEERADAVRSALVAWYRERAEEKLPHVVAAWANNVGVEPRSVLVREPKQRWGSCDAKGNVRLNWRIIQAPRKLVDYVVAHELVHLVHDDHGPAFWAMLGRAMPDYEMRREALRRRGVEWVW